ncbi:hypothetical protein HID58_074157 [Brassica napus]|uniref:Uncharacterized protein n=1 Tax=Brassica napus TaxID=3708 RepID=A0ABQ7YJ46_BRANA|nr:hypothetical protein HID58_074157 [Brassica napus]
MSRIPPCSLKHIYAPCSLQHIDSCGRKGGVVLAKYKEIKALRLKVRNQEEAGEMAAAENVSLRETAMAVNGGKVAARWELMREWINGQTDSSDPTNVLEQYKTVKITEAKLLGLPTPSFESELRVLGDVEAEKIPEPVADDPSVQPSDSNLYPPNS